MNGPGETVNEKPPYQEIKDLWNANMPNSKIFRLGDTRRRKIDARWKVAHFRMAWPVVMLKIGRSAFCKGENDRGWVATFDWLFRNDDTWLRVLERRSDSEYQQPGRLR